MNNKKILGTLLSAMILLAAMGCWFCWHCPSRVYEPHALFWRQLAWNSAGSTKRSNGSPPVIVRDALMFREHERTSQEHRANVPCRKHKENMCDCVRHLFRNWKC